jgi:D-glycero-D-manno-heptose 1,7-bisphosphate phosphatase
MNKAVFLDRDGVINRKARKGSYITGWEQMHFLAGVAEAIAELNHAGFKVIVISNQRCIAKGLLTVRKLEAMHRRMRNWLASQGATVDGIYYCPHEKTKPPCSCRKPAPGMLLTAAGEHEIDLTASWMIGDSDSDMQAGRSAGCRTIRLDTTAKTTNVWADAVETSLPHAVQKILGKTLPCPAHSK